MLERVQAILESVDPKLIVNNKTLYEEANEAVENFPKQVKAFIIGHPDEFIGEDTEDTYKNMRVFTEIATAQYIHEVTTVMKQLMAQEEASRPSINDYL